MDYVKPADVAKSMVETGSKKLALPISSLLIRGIMSGAILGVATSLAFNGAFTTGQPQVGAIMFPVGLIMIVLLGIELVTGSSALVPLPFIRGEATCAPECPRERDRIGLRPARRAAAAVSAAQQG